MSTQTIFELVTFVVTLILGELTKRTNLVEDKKIPIQNLIVGLIVAFVEFFITKDFETSIAVSGLLAGGTYDLIHNIRKLKGE